MLYHNICYECQATFGSRNPDRLFYVIRCPQSEMGFFAVYNYVVYHLDKAEKLGAEPIVDWKYYPNKYFSEDDSVGKDNVWEYFFENILDISLDEVYKSKNVIMSSGVWEIPVKEVFDDIRLEHSHAIIEKYIKFNAKTEAIYKAECDRVGIGTHRVLGVKCRGTDFVKTRPKDHQIVPDSNTTISTIEEKMHEWGVYDRIYLATEDTSILNDMKAYYGEKLWYTNGRTFELKDNKWLSEMYDSSSEKTKENDMRTYLIQTYILGTCDALIAPEVGGTIGAMRIKGKYEHVHIFQLGQYD